jgi:hypothetical protein
MLERPGSDVEALCPWTQMPEFIEGEWLNPKPSWVEKVPGICATEPKRCGAMKNLLKALLLGGPEDKATGAGRRGLGADQRHHRLEREARNAGDP